ncbi:MAG: M1 family metallopeptidase [Myxococcales bacterium]|nr:M1 family metallopeptidase [Myxococcales bacterium]
MREPALPCPPHVFEEPAAGRARRRPVPVIPEHVRLAVRVDPTTRQVSGAVTHTVVGRAAPTTGFTVDAADQVILAVRGEDGAPLPFHVHAGGVDVTLAAPLGPGERTQVTLAFEATPTLGLHFVDAEGDRPAQAWTQGAMEDHHHWFPCFDAPEHVVTTEVIATVPAGYQALSNGVPVALDEPMTDGFRRFHWRHDTPHALYLLTLVVDAVVEVVDTRGEVPLHHYVPAGREADARHLFARMPEMLTWFAEATGVPYPYPRYGHAILRQFMWGGMENTTLTSLTDFALVPAADRDAFDVERLFAHELAHQWFGDLIAPRGWPEIWLNESFATWFEIRCMGALNGEDDFAARLQAWRDGYLAEARDRYARPVVTRTYAHPYVLFDRHAYEKGCLLLHTLRHQLGAVAFDAGLQAYIQQARGTAAETALLRRCLEDASGEDLADFFEDFVTAGAHPRARVAWSYDRRVGLELTLARQDDTPQSLVLDVLIQGAATHHRRVRLAPGTRTLTLPLDDAPVFVAVDPEQACLVELDESGEDDAALLARLVADVPVALRMRTARLLGQRADPVVTAALIARLAQESSVSVRVEVAAALGEHRAEAAREALARVVKSDAPLRVRVAAAAACGVGADARHLPWLQGLAAEPVPARVLAALLGAIGATRAPDAVAILQPFVGVPSTRDCVAAAAVDALGALGQVAVADVLFAQAAPTRPRVVRQAAIVGLGRLARLEEADRALRRRCRETLEATLSDGLFHARYAAAGALKGLADAASRPALVRAHDAERFGLVRRVLREALGVTAA